MIDPLPIVDVAANARPEQPRLKDDEETLQDIVENSTESKHQTVGA